jgi:phosphonate transport system substrate-binding protein
MVKVAWTLVFLTGVISSTVALSGEQPVFFTLARAPQRSSSAIVIAWQPFADFLSRETNAQFRLKLYHNRSEFEEDLLHGRPDFIYMSPYYHLVAKKNHAYIPLVRSGTKKLKGILVVRKDSPVETPQDLDGKILAFPSPNAFAASLYLRALLSKKERINFTTLYVETHDNVYPSVVFGHADAGGGVMRTLSAERAELRNQLRVIYQTPGTAPHPLSAHPRLPQALRESVTRAVLKLNMTEQGRHMLDTLKIASPVRANHEMDYSPIEELGLRPFGTLEQ